MNETKNYFALRLREHRRRCDLTQEELAEKLCISPQSVSKWERGDGCPDINMLPKIAGYLGITTDALLGFDEVTKKEEAEKFSNEFWEMETYEERVEFAGAYIENHPDDFDAILYFCDHSMHLSFEDRKKYLPAIKKHCNNIIERSTNQFFREEAIRFMCNICDDDEFEKWSAMCADSYAAYKGEVLESRLWEQGRHNDSRIQHDVNNLHLILHFMCRENRNWAASEKATEWHKFRIKLIETFAEYTGKGEIPSAWIWVYIETKFRCACSLFGSGRKDEGYEYLEEAFRLLEENRDTISRKDLEFGCEQIFGGVSMTLDDDGNRRLKVPDGKGGYTKEKCNYFWWLRADKGLFYYAMTAPSGWEWFNSVRDEERFKEYVARAKKICESHSEDE